VTPVNRPSWLDALTDEDRQFLRRLLLASGSLKALAQEYGVSYPTIRLRLDRLIDKVRLMETLLAVSPFERQLRMLYADGKIDLESLKLLLQAHRQEVTGSAESAGAPTAPTSSVPSARPAMGIPADTATVDSSPSMVFPAATPAPPRPVLDDGTAAPSAQE
jgi:hypothetical protein